jgi:NAD(P)-dependent dehydrogenase (short-subunit alcohol dehydrogenase family)
LGAACARRLCAAGGRVVLADVNVESGQQLAGELGASARFARVDVTNSDDIQAAIGVARGELGGLSGAINCAGVLHGSRIMGRDGPYDLDAFRRVIEVNLIGTFNVMRLIAAALADNGPNDEGERGVIINTSSVATWDGQIGQASYAASKGAVAALSLPAARELAKLGIRVVAIAPGVFATPMMEGLTDELRESLESQIPFPSRLGRPDEYASLAQQIIENPMHNGSVLRLDGALRMGKK